jgi:hypothetical protein
MYGPAPWLGRGPQGPQKLMFSGKSGKGVRSMGLEHFAMPTQPGLIADNQAGQRWGGRPNRIVVADERDQPRISKPAAASALMAYSCGGPSGTSVEHRQQSVMRPTRARSFRNTLSQSPFHQISRANLHRLPVGADLPGDCSASYHSAWRYASTTKATCRCRAKPP